MTTANSQYSGEASWSLVQVITITCTLLSMTTANSQYSGEASWSFIQVIVMLPLISEWQPLSLFDLQ